MADAMKYALDKGVTLDEALKKLGDPSKATEAFNKMASTLTRAFERDITGNFALDGPTTLTVKNRKGEYRKRPFIGAELFKPTGAYIGKRDGLIYIFKPVAPSEFSTIEMKEEDAYKNLRGFQAYTNGILSEVFEETAASVRERVAALEHEEKVKTELERYQNPAYATW